jgi:hypothetical protein
MTGSQTFSNLTRELIEEHRQIHFYLDQLERSLASLQAAEPLGSVEPLRWMAVRIEGLRERLIEHFTSEESDGLFRAMGEAIPPLRGALIELAEDHPRLLTLLGMARVRAQHGGPHEMLPLRRELEAFLRAVRAHESREEALLLEVIRHQPPV